MKPIVFVVLLLVCLGSVAVAQDVPRYEISGAATFLRDPANANRYGWLGSFARNVNDWFAVKGEAAGYYSKENARIHTFVGGPQFRINKDAKVSPWAHFLVGAQKDHQFVFPGNLVPRTYFAMVPGGGIDVSLNPRFSVRLGADYVRGFRSNSLDDVEHYRLQSGVVFKLP